MGLPDPEGLRLWAELVVALGAAYGAILAGIWFVGGTIRGGWRWMRAVAHVADTEEKVGRLEIGELKSIDLEKLVKDFHAAEAVVAKHEERLAANDERWRQDARVTKERYRTLISKQTGMEARLSRLITQTDRRRQEDDEAREQQRVHEAQRISRIEGHLGLSTPEQPPPPHNKS